MTHVAVLGAGGFIGRRTVDILRSQGHQVTSLVRSASNCPSSNQLSVDARNEEGLAEAFKGSEVVVASIAGSPDTIVRVVNPIYRAANRAGVKRIIHLSSAVVHGQAPSIGTDESTPLSHTQPFAYNRAKIEAEEGFRHLRDKFPVEVVMLRPGIVYGPGSRWIAGFADDLRTRRTIVFDRGEGICNAVHVDNVVHAIEKALGADVPPAAAFLINDCETVRWRDLYAPVAAFLGRDFDQLPSRSSAEFLKRQSGRGASTTRIFGWARKWRSRSAEKAEALLEAALLQSCRVRLPIEKAQRCLGYAPPVSFAEGMRQSVRWLREADYWAHG